MVSACMQGNLVSPLGFGYLLQRRMSCPSNKAEKNITANLLQQDAVNQCSELVLWCEASEDKNKTIFFLFFIIFFK